MHREVARKNSSLIAAQAALPDYIDLSQLVTPDAMLSFMRFCYEHTTTNNEAEDNELDPAGMYTELIQLYHLASLLGSTSLANHCIDRIVTTYEQSDEVPGVKAVGEVWKEKGMLQGQAGPSGLKRLMADLWVVSKADIMAVHGELPSELVALCYVAKGIEAVTADNAFHYYELDLESAGFEAVEADEGDEELVMVVEDAI